MLRAEARLVLGRAVEEFQVEVDRAAAVDRDIGKSLFLEPAAKVVEAVLAGGGDDGGLLSLKPEQLVTRANGGLGRPIPQNGRRWPLLVRAAAKSKGWRCGCSSSPP